MIEAAAQIFIAGATFAMSLKLTGDHTEDTPLHRRLAGIGEDGPQRGRRAGNDDGQRQCL